MKFFSERSNKTLLSVLCLITVLASLYTPFSLAADEIIIDDNMPGFSEIGGKWTSSGGAPGYNNSNSKWAQGTDAEVRWTPEALSGNYEVSIYKCVNSGNTPKQVYTVIHNGKKNTFEIDMKTGDSG